MLRKVILLIMVIVMVSLVGITSVTAQESFLEKIKGAGIKADGSRIKVGIIAGELNSEFAIVLSGYAEWLLRQAGCEVDFVNAEWDLNRQIGFFEDFTTMGKEVIICQGVDIYALTNAVRKAQENGLKVIATNNPMLDKEDNLVCDFYTGSPNIAMAQAAAKFFGEKAAGKKVNMVQIMGNLANLNARQRDIYFREVLEEKYPNIEIVNSQAGDWISDKAYNLMMDMLTATPDIWGVYSHSDCMNPGIMSALRQAGKLYPVGDERHIQMVSIDGAPLAIQTVREGTLDVTITQKAYDMAILSAKVALMVGKGIDLPKFPDNYVEVGTVNITTENEADPILWANYGVPKDELWPSTQKVFEYYKYPGDEKIFE